MWHVVRGTRENADCARDAHLDWAARTRSEVGDQAPALCKDTVLSFIRNIDIKSVNQRLTFCASTLR